MPKLVKICSVTHQYSLSEKACELKPMVCDDVSDHEEMFMVIKVPAQNCTSYIQNELAHIQNELVPLFD